MQLLVNGKFGLTYTLLTKIYFWIGYFYSIQFFEVLMLNAARLRVLINQIERRIPKRITDFYKNENHRRMVAVKYGADKAFLDSDNLKFTVIDPANGQYRCDLITVSLFKAMWNCHRPTKKPLSYYVDILNQAKDLYKHIGCQDILEDAINLPDDFNVGDLK